ncbi:MAG: hypothetical protein EB060_06375 [Proteobacteria bacterium]|nr:hypothetical protein [Pseudomonadota bacterium]
MLEELFSSLGLDRDQTSIYFHLLENGSATAGVLAKKIPVPRATLYYMLQQLTDKGIIIRSLKFGVRTFTAQHPQKIMQLFQQKVDLYSQQREKFKLLMPELEHKMAKHYFRPTFQIYEGEQGIQNALRDTILYRDVETLSFWPLKVMTEIAPPAFFDYLNRERVAANNSLRALWPENYTDIDLKKFHFFGASKELKRTVRIAPAGIDWSMGYMVYANKVLFISSRHEMFAFIVESADLAAVQRVQFEFMWQQSKQLVRK